MTAEDGFGDDQVAARRRALFSQPSTEGHGEIQRIVSLTLDLGASPLLLDFSGLDPQAINPAIMVAALRTCFGGRSLIPTWERGLEACIDAINLAGMDSRSVCRGLLNA